MTTITKNPSSKTMEIAPGNNIDREKLKNCNIQFTVTKDKTYKHIERSKEIILELSKVLTLKFEDTNIKDNKDLDYKYVIEIIEQLNNFLTIHNTEYIRELPRILNPQAHEPNDKYLETADSVTKNLWNNLDKSIELFFDVSDEFISLRNNFALIFHNIKFMIKQGSLVISNDELDKISQYTKQDNDDSNQSDKSIINIEEDMKINEDESNSRYKKSYLLFHEILKSLPGTEYLENILNNVDTYNNDYKNAKIKYDNATIEFNEEADKNIQTLNDKISEFKTQEKERDDWYDKYQIAFDNQNKSEFDEYHRKFKENESQMMSLAKQIQSYQDLLKKNKTNFEENLYKNLEIDMNNKKQIIIDIQGQINSLFSQTGIHDLVKNIQFIKQLQMAEVTAVKHASKVIKFKELIKALSNILFKNKNQILTVQWYFTQANILEGLIKPLQNKGIETMEQLQNQYSSDSKRKNELIPFIESELNRKLKLGEIKKLKRVCNMDLTQFL